MRNTPDNNLAYPSLFKLSNGDTCFGFLLNTGGKILFIIFKIFTEFKNNCKFVATVPVLLPIRTAHGSFFFIGFTVKLIHLLCLSTMHPIF